MIKTYACIIIITIRPKVWRKAYRFFIQITKTSPTAIKSDST